LTEASAPKTRSLFLSIEGIDGAGKTTQLEMLQNALRGKGFTVVRVRDPGGTELGDRLRSLLLDRPVPIGLNAEALLFFASRAQLVGEKIRPALDAGHVVLTDRFTLSTVVYQGHAGGLDPAQLWKAASLATGGLEPDLCFVLDMDPELACKRRSGPTDHMERKPTAFHQRVRAGFLAEAQSPQHPIVVLDAKADPDSIHQDILHRVETRLAQPSGGAHR